MVPVDGRLHGLEQPAARLRPLALAAGRVAQGDAGPGGEPLDGPDEVEVLDLPHEGDDVARLQPKQW